MPNAYIIAGPNGAGKTTFAREFLPNYAHCKNFVNADLIAGGISPLDPDAAAFRAGRLMVEEIRSLASRHLDFGFESTLSGRARLQLIRELKEAGYAVHIFSSCGFQMQISQFLALRHEWLQADTALLRRQSADDLNGRSRMFSGTTNPRHIRGCSWTTLYVFRRCSPQASARRSTDGEVMFTPC